MGIEALIIAVSALQIALTSADSSTKPQSELDCKSYRELVISEAAAGRVPVAIGNVINEANDVRMIVFASKTGDWQLVIERPSTHTICKSMFGNGWTMIPKAVLRKLPR